MICCCIFLLLIVYDTFSEERCFYPSLEEKWRRESTSTNTMVDVLSYSESLINTHSHMFCGPGSILCEPNIKSKKTTSSHLMLWDKPPSVWAESFAARPTMELSCWRILGIELIFLEHLMGIMELCNVAFCSFPLFVGIIVTTSGPSFLRGSTSFCEKIVV